MLHLRVPIQQLRNKPIFNLCHFISLLLIQSWNTVQSVPPVHCAAQIECIPDWRVGATPIKIITFLCFASLVGLNADCTIHESRMAPTVHNGLHPTCNPKVLQGTKHSHSHATATSAFRPSSKGHALCGTLRSSVAPCPHIHIDAMSASVPHRSRHVRRREVLHEPLGIDTLLEGALRHGLGQSACHPHLFWSKATLVVNAQELHDLTSLHRKPFGLCFFPWCLFGILRHVLQEMWASFKVSRFFDVSGCCPMVSWPLSSITPMLPPVSWIMSLLCVEASSPPWWRRNSSTWQGDVHLQTSQPMPEVAPTKSTKVIEGDWTITTWTEALHYGLLLRELFTRQWWNEESALTTVCVKSHGWHCRTDHHQHFGDLVIKAPWLCKGGDAAHHIWIKDTTRNFKDDDRFPSHFLFGISQATHHLLVMEHCQPAPQCVLGQVVVLRELDVEHSIVPLLLLQDFPKDGALAHFMIPPDEDWAGVVQVQQPVEFVLPKCIVSIVHQIQNANMTWKNTYLNNKSLLSRNTQANTTKKKSGAGRLDCLPFNVDRWLMGCKRGIHNDIFHSFLFLTMPPHIPSEGHDGQWATATNQPFSNLFRGRLLFCTVAWEATVATSACHEKPKTTTSGNEATRHTHGGNLQSWDCAGAQALYNFLMRWLVHSATHAASRTHLILWAFVSLSAAGESNQHLWV